MLASLYGKWATVDCSECSPSKQMMVMMVMAMSMASCDWHHRPILVLFACTPLQRNQSCGVVSGILSLSPLSAQESNFHPTVIIKGSSIIIIITATMIIIISVIPASSLTRQVYCVCLPLVSVSREEGRRERQCQKDGWDKQAKRGMRNESRSNECILD